MALTDLLHELEKTGLENDASAQDYQDKLLNITRDTGEFLAVLVKAAGAEKVLEIGTSNGYSTLWLASSLPEAGRVVTVEALPHKIEQAARNFERAGLQDRIKIEHTTAIDYFANATEQFDFIFLDANRNEYMQFAAQVVDCLAPGGVLVCDNAVSHTSELAPFMDFIRNHPAFTSCLVPVGKGEFVAYKETADR